MNKKLTVLLSQIFKDEDLINDPPVLIDIGASGNIHERWKSIAPYSVCIAFDADSREMGYIAKENSAYKKLLVFNSVVSSQKNSSIDFFLTRFPFCSSSLEPDLEELRHYEFAHLFKVEEKIKLNSVHLPDVLRELNITKVDWYKSDSQGTDLRLFKSLGDELCKKVMVAEFESGIINAYKEEDKLFSVMNCLHAYPFWMSGMEVKGNYRIPQDLFSSFSDDDQKKIHRSLKTSPAWAEVVYFNTLESEDLQTNRNLLLGWVFATLLGQHGFAFEIASKIQQLHAPELADELKNYSFHSLTHPDHDFRKRVVSRLNRFLKRLE